MGIEEELKKKLTETINDTEKNLKKQDEQVQKWMKDAEKDEAFAKKCEETIKDLINNNFGEKISEKAQEDTVLVSGPYGTTTGNEYKLGKCDGIGKIEEAVKRDIKEWEARTRNIITHSKKIARKG